MKRRPAIIANRRRELLAGAVLFLGSSWLVWDAYEGRGKPRPFLARFLP